MERESNGRPEIVIAALLLVGLGIKIPVWPLTPGCRPPTPSPLRPAPVLLVAVLLKMGTYGVVRLVIAPLPIGIRCSGTVVRFCRRGRHPLGRSGLPGRERPEAPIAYSSVAHMGFEVLGLSSGTTVGLQAACSPTCPWRRVRAASSSSWAVSRNAGGSADLATARAALREISPRLGFALVVGSPRPSDFPDWVGFWGRIPGHVLRVEPGS